MPGTNLFYCYWKTEEGNFRSILDSLKQEPEKETVHAFRVSVKKLRAYLRLYYLLAGEDPDNEQLFEEINELFDTLGFQRNIEICLDMLEIPSNMEAGLFPSFKVFLLAQLEKSKTVSAEAVGQFNDQASLKIGKFLREEAMPVEPGTIPELTGNILHAVATGKKHLHRARHRLKEIYYWLTQLPEVDARAEELKNRIAKTLYKLGSWQDAEVFIRYAKHFRKDFLPEHTGEYIELKAKEKMLQKGKSVIARSAWKRIKKLDESLD